MKQSTIKSNLSLSCFLTLMLFTIALAQMPAANQQSNITSRVDQLFARWDRPDSPECVLGVIRDGKFIYKKCYGMANLEHDIAISPTTVFNIASASQQFTAMSILLLAREGKLSLDDDIRKYLPELPSYQEQIKLVLSPALNDEFLFAGFDFDFTRDRENKVNGFLLDTGPSINLRFFKRK